MGDSLVLSDDLPQPKNVYLEQIEVLKPIIANSVPKDSNKQKSMPDLSGDAGPSGKIVSNKGKTTIYNAKLDSAAVSSSKEKCKPGTMLEKLEKAAPYNLFFTTINKAPETLNQPNAITFTGEYMLCMFKKYKWYL